MDQEALDRVCRGLRARRESLGNATSEVGRLRKDGYSMMESMYIVSNVFEMPPSEAKRLVMASESGDAKSYIDEFHNAAEDDFRS